MIGSIFESIFGCSHSRLTRPITPVSKPGVPSGETYVVCLDCGKQFAYDWNHMRIGEPIKRSPDSGVLNPDMPSRSKSKIKYALLGSAIPLAVLAGNALMNSRRAKTQPLPKHVDPLPESGADWDHDVELRHGARFRVRELVDYIAQSGRDYIIDGDVDCALADHPKPSSLDYWLRENFAKNKESKQATDEVVAQLVATGSFEQREDLRCPDSGQKCKGLRLKFTLEPAAKS